MIFHKATDLIEYYKMKKAGKLPTFSFYKVCINKVNYYLAANFLAPTGITVLISTKLFK